MTGAHHPEVELSCCPSVKAQLHRPSTRVLGNHTAGHYVRRPCPHTAFKSPLPMQPSHDCSLDSFLVVPPCPDIDPLLPFADLLQSQEEGNSSCVRRLELIDLRDRPGVKSAPCQLSVREIRRLDEIFHTSSGEDLVPQCSDVEIFQRYSGEEGMADADAEHHQYAEPTEPVERHQAFRPYDGSVQNSSMLETQPTT